MSNFPLKVPPIRFFLFFSMVYLIQNRKKCYKEVIKNDKQKIIKKPKKTIQKEKNNDIMPMIAKQRRNRRKK